jgi:hypothetical protein
MQSCRERFLAKIVKTDNCWEWQGHLTKGYGRFHMGKSWVSHRAAYTLLVGEIPDGMHVLHRCDNRRCCNPEHLFLGTNADNMADKAAKGRVPDMTGAKNPNSRLTEKDIEDIRALYATGTKTQKEIGKMYGVTQVCISQVVTGLHWK